MFNRSRSRKVSKAGKRPVKMDIADSRLVQIDKDLRMLAIATMVQPLPGIVDIPKKIISPRKTYTIKQNAYLGVITTAGTGTFGAFSVSLNTFTNNTALQLMFDAWRIDQLTFRFVPNIRPGTGVSNPPLLTAIDYDDAAVPTSTASLREYDTMYEVPWGNYVERTLSPKAATAVYSGAFTSFAQYDGWIDMGSPATQWYGLKFATDSGTVYTAAYTVEVEAILNFKAVR